MQKHEKEMIFREIKSEMILEMRTELDFPGHLHDDIELIFPMKGRGISYCDGKRYEVTENSFHMVFPNQVHNYIGFPEGEYVVIIVKPQDLLSYKAIFSDKIPLSNLVELSTADAADVKAILSLALNEFKAYGYSTVVAAYVTAIVGKLLANTSLGEKRVRSDTISRILGYCLENYKNKISVPTVAKDLNVSVSAVSHAFSRLSISFTDYINSLRIAEARNLLSNSDLSITEIAYLSGFSTIRSFNRAFLKHFGMPPTKAISKF